MAHNLLILPSAEKEMQDGFDWYEERQGGLGERFLNAVERQLKRIVDNPEHYQIKQRGYKEGKVEVFPYIIVFKFYPAKGEIIVISVFHTSRKPNKKYRK